MRRFLSFEAGSPDKFKKQLLAYSLNMSAFMMLENRQDKEYRKNPNTHSSMDCMVGVGQIDCIEGNAGNAFADVKAFSNLHNEWMLGYWGYDLKNEIEKLDSCNHDGLDFSSYYFFIPRFLVFFLGKHVQVAYLPKHDDKTSTAAFVNDVLEQEIHSTANNKAQLKKRLSKQEYIRRVENVQEHIQRGDIYEANFCQEFYDDNASIHPQQTYLQLREMSPTPFMCFMRMDKKYVLSASPERFLKRSGNKLIAQPMKGTSKRSNIPDEDEANRLLLQNDKKERAENIMIVDLVRNDLTKIAQPRTVRVEELCGVYSFRQVHQMVSTVTAKVANDQHFTDIIKANFPMGSMTGAPKMRAMEIIEDQELTQRGLFSGAIGYVSPNKDFDFNVVIRSMLYNQERNYLSVQVGSAITSLANAESEYEECLLKAEALRRILD